MKIKKLNIVIEKQSDKVLDSDSEKLLPKNKKKKNKNTKEDNKNEES